MNEANDTVGKVDDIIIADNGKSPYVVLSVGGFLGIGEKLVVLPYEQLTTMDRKIVMQGASKAALKDLPSFRYAANQSPTFRIAGPALPSQARSLPKRPR